jgi:hypothetical protein
MTGGFRGMTGGVGQMTGGTETGVGGYGAMGAAITGAIRGGSSGIFRDDTERKPWLVELELWDIQVERAVVVVKKEAEYDAWVQ